MRNPITGIFTNSHDPDEMPHNAYYVFHLYFIQEIPMSYTTFENSSDVICDLGNPLPAKSRVGSVNFM